METNTNEQQTLNLDAPRISWLKPADFIDNRARCEIIEVQKIPSAKFRGAFDTDLVVKFPSGLKRRFSVWGDNYDIIYEFCKQNNVSVVGRMLVIKIDGKEVNGKIVQQKTVESIQ